MTAGQKIVEAPIRPALFEALGVTMSIVLGGAILVLLLAMPLGAIAGRYAGTWLDRTISLVALIAICTHPMVVGLILRTMFANRLHWVPPTGYCNLIANKDSVCSGPEQWASHLVLPWITFALLFLALYIRMVRSSVIDTLHEDFVRTARAKGVREARVLRRHVVPHASLRVLTMVGMEVGTAIGVCLYIEAAFGFVGPRAHGDQQLHRRRRARPAADPRRRDHDHLHRRRREPDRRHAVRVPRPARGRVVPRPPTTKEAAGGVI